MKQKSIKDNLVYQRKLKGYTQDQLSEKTTVTVRTIQRIEKGEVQPHLQTVKLLAAGLDVEVEDLLVLDNPKEVTVERKWLLLIHGSPFFGLLIPLANILFPLFIWISKAEDNRLYDQHGRAVINFHSSISLYVIVSLLLFFVIPGYNFFITGVIALFGLIMGIKNIMSSLDNGSCYYPLSIPFLTRK